MNSGLNIGDKIIAVNGTDIANLNHGDVVNLIKNSGRQVRLTIGDPKENMYYFNEISSDRNTNFVNNYFNKDQFMC